MNSPSVSVCIPCRNSERHLAQALDSVLGQSYPHVETIVVDDGSTDGSAAILQQYRQRGVKVIDERCGSASKARNLALRHAEGELIKFLDADDRLSRECIAAQVGRLADRNDAIASAKWGRFYNDDLSTFRPNPEPNWKDMESTEWLVEACIDCRGMMQAGMFLIPRGLLEKSGPWNEGLTLIDDFEFFSRVLCAAKEVLFCPEAVLYYRSGTPGTLSGQKSRAAYESMTESILLGTGHLLARRQDARARLAAANVCQHGVYDLYPQHHDLRRKLEARIEECGGSTVSPFGGRYFHALRPFIGWKLAKRLQKLAGR